jgi:large subunit ribosomal protein L21
MPIENHVSSHPSKKEAIMYAIVEIAGHQYKVQQDQRLYVNRLKDDEGAKVSFDRVLLVDDGSKVTVGAPAVSGAAVQATVERHLKGDKVLVFKKKRRKGYQKLNGFRPSLTELVINGIALGAKPKKAAAKKAEEGEDKAEAKPAAKKPAAKKPAAKKAAADKPAAKKPAAKKPAAKKSTEDKAEE